MVPGLGSGPFDFVFEGNYSDNVVNATHYEVTHKATGSHVDGQGTIEPAENGPKLLLDGNWRGLRWPLVARFTAEAPQIFSSPEGKYHLEGLWPYAISASGELFVPQLDPMTVAVRGALHKDHLQMDELELGAFGGKGDLAGEARWSPAESWSLAGSVKGMNPGSLRPGFNGSLDFNMKASGAPFGGDGTLDFAFSDLSGKLRGSNATGSGRIQLQGENWTFNKLRFRAGNTRLAIDGELGASRALNLDFSLDADNLALLAEDARGELHASGRVGGTSDAPIVKLTARGSEIEHGTLSVSKLAANIDVDWRGFAIYVTIFN
jgi:translocation and assembly module TamB